MVEQVEDVCVLLKAFIHFHTERRETVTNNNARSFSTIDLVFLICLLIINGAFIVMLLFTSFSIAFGVTSGSVDMTLTDITKMNVDFIKTVFSLMVLNISLIVTFRWVKSGCNNPFRKKKTIGEMMKEKKQ